MYFVALLMFVLSIALPDTDSDLATIGGFIFLGLAMHASQLKKDRR